ncbi:flavin monoamine oxidase family protein [Coleofasciculus sp. F4-SAH-05]|uniref:flavin monoamine oxidase family protein n=1 Tax=Coleofasciculus sp. F4-SAH-05 TaxID=3069525 RepID=UPI0032FA7590
MNSRFFTRRQFIQGISQSTLAFLGAGYLSQFRASALNKPTSVLVIGAGLSGLYAALILEKQGFLVTVLEGRNRVGGRVHTLDDLPGKPEAGGQGLGEKYSRFIKLANRLNAPLKPRPQRERQLLLHVNGQSVLASDWESSPANRLAESEKTIIPPALLTHYLRPNNPLEQNQDWTLPEYSYLDISLKDYLRQQGASPEALRLMNVYPFSMNSIESASALWGLRNDQRAKTRSRSSIRVKEGNSRFPEKIAASLTSPLYTQKVVEAIYSQDTGVKVYCTDGSSFTADYAICTLPFSVLRQIPIYPPLEAEQKEAVEQLPYTKVTQIHLSVREPFWEADGYPVNMWTDSFLELVFPVKDETGKVQGLVGWANGENADKLDALSAREVEEQVKAQLKQMRPQTAGNVEITRVVTWGSDPFSLGAYAYFAPGQIQVFQTQMQKPWQRIHFAGEHTAIASPGMEAALESAERVVMEILQRQR